MPEAEAVEVVGYGMGKRAGVFHEVCWRTYDERLKNRPPGSGPEPRSATQTQAGCSLTRSRTTTRCGTPAVPGSRRIHCRAVGLDESWSCNIAAAPLTYAPSVASLQQGDHLGVHVSRGDFDSRIHFFDFSDLRVRLRLECVHRGSVTEHVDDQVLPRGRIEQLERCFDPVHAFALQPTRPRQTCGTRRSVPPSCPVSRTPEQSSLPPVVALVRWVRRYRELACAATRPFVKPSRLGGPD